jgi:hypothetical protein
VIESWDWYGEPYRREDPHAAADTREAWLGYQVAMAALALLLVILVIAWLTIRKVRAGRAFHAAGVRTEAEITDIRWKTVGPLPDRDRLTFPLVRFTLPDGSVIETRSEVAADGPQEVGDRVPIMYLPDQPGRARINRR